MTWLYAVVACALVVRWSLWYLRDVLEWLAAPRRDHLSPAMLARLQLQRDRAARRMAPAPALHLSEEAAGGPRGA